MAEQQPQRQDSLADQLVDVLNAANRMGCYDAADFIRRQVQEQRDEAARQQARGYVRRGH